MRQNYNRRRFIKNTASAGIGITLAGSFMPEMIVAGEPQSKYEWLSHARVFIIDGYYYPLNPEIEYDAQKIARAMAEMHANVIRIATSGSLDWFIPGTPFATAAELGNRDLLAETIAACKPLGIKVLPYLQCGASVSPEVMKPGWEQVINPGGETSMAVCWNTTYKQAFFELVRAVVSRYDVDGVYFDSWLPFYSFTGQICYCEGCRTGFKKSHGKEIPYREKGDRYTSDETKTIDLYREWYTDNLYEAFSETKRIIKSYKDIPLIYNINNPSRILDKFQNNMRIMEESDALLYERGKSMIERAEGVSLATAHGITVWPYVGTYDPSPRIPHFNHELIQEIYTTVAFGGSPVLYHTYFFADHPESRLPLTEAFELIDRNHEFYEGFRSDKFCAVVWNDKDPAGHASRGYLWETNARLSSLGSFTACLKGHIQTTSILKIDLDDPEKLDQYKVLYLPDICYLSDRQIENITGFVEKGGGLVMTYATSLYDEGGNRRPDFALGKLAGIRSISPDERISKVIKSRLQHGSVIDLYLKTVPGQEVIKSPLSGNLIPAHLFETVEALPGSQVIAGIVAGNKNEHLVPGLIVSRHGKGKVAYIAPAMGAIYLQCGVKEYSDFIRNVVEYVSPAQLPYEIEAPHSTLIINMMVNGDKRVFHLVNWPGSQSERMWQNVYHIPPVEDVTIKFRIPAGKKISKVSSFVQADITRKIEGAILSMNLSGIENYQGVVIEMT